MQDNGTAPKNPLVNVKLPTIEEKMMPEYMARMNRFGLHLYGKVGNLGAEFLVDEDRKVLFVEAETPMP